MLQLYEGALSAGTHTRTHDRHRHDAQCATGVCVTDGVVVNAVRKKQRGVHMIFFPLAS